MSMPELIAKKRRGTELTEGEIRWFAEAVEDGGVPDYQVSALLMSICYEKLSFNETLYLTNAFVDSGETLTWDGFDKPVVDKHSTGGVGDSVSLLLLPWLAAEGFIVPKMSGRGLGHTGGTIDKLESIPGFRTDLSPAEMREVLEKVGCCVVQQSANLVPADKKLYALRDATGTVDEMGLIAASVVSKKIAAGADYIVLDVKCGNGAFFKTEDRAREFAGVAIRLGKEFGKRIGCVISDMNQPLSSTVGNRLEVEEVVSLLESFRSGAKDQDSRLVRVADALRVTLKVVSGMSRSFEEAKALVNPENIQSKFTSWVDAQSGKQEELALLTVSQQVRKIPVTSPKDGFVHAFDTLAIGEFARSLGAGRYKKDDVIDPDVGLRMHCSIGDRVEAGQPVGEVIASSNDMRAAEKLSETLLNCLTIGRELRKPIDPVIDIIL